MERRGVKLITAGFIFLIVVCLLTLSLTVPTSETEKTKPLVGICLCDMLEECWYNSKHALVSELQAFGLDTLVQNANNSQEKQNEQIQYLVELGADVIIVTPVNSADAAETIRKAREKGVQIIAYERMVKDVPVDAYYGFDNEAAGRMLVEGLLKSMTSGHIMIINGDAGADSTNQISKGYYGGLGPYMTSEKITVLRTEWATEWDREVAYNAVESAFDSGIELDGILAATDSIAGEAIEALAERGYAGRIPVIGINGDLTACQRINEGVQCATVLKNYRNLALETAHAAYRMAKGYPISTNSVMDESWGKLPAYILQPQLITLDNLTEEVIDKGIYTREMIERTE